MRPFSSAAPFALVVGLSGSLQADLPSAHEAVITPVTRNLRYDDWKQDPFLQAVSYTKGPIFGLPSASDVYAPPPDPPVPGYVPTITPGSKQCDASGKLAAIDIKIRPQDGVATFDGGLTGFEVIYAGGSRIRIHFNDTAKISPTDPWPVAWVQTATLVSNDVLNKAADTCAPAAPGTPAPSSMLQRRFGPLTATL